MKRFVDWAVKFHDYIDAVKATPFEWGSHNCAHICAGEVQAITGKDLMVGFKRAKSTKDFLRLMKDKGFDDLSLLVESKLPKIHISKARIGDIAAIADDTPFGYSLGIVNGEMILTFNENGMGFRPLFDASHAFKVGD